MCLTLSLEFLNKIGRQATVIIFREAYEDYLFPVGMWSVRESIREAYRGRAEKHMSLLEAILYIASKLRIDIKRRLQASYILNFVMRQRKLTRYIK